MNAMLASFEILYSYYVGIFYSMKYPFSSSICNCKFIIFYFLFFLIQYRLYSPRASFLSKPPSTDKFCYILPLADKLILCLYTDAPFREPAKAHSFMTCFLEHIQVWTVLRSKYLSHSTPQVKGRHSCYHSPSYTVHS